MKSTCLSILFLLAATFAFAQLLPAKTTLDLRTKCWVPEDQTEMPELRNVFMAEWNPYVFKTPYRHFVEIEFMADNTYRLKSGKTCENKPDTIFYEPQTGMWSMEDSNVVRLAHYSKLFGKELTDTLWSNGASLRWAYPGYAQTLTFHRKLRFLPNLESLVPKRPAAVEIPKFPCYFIHWH